MVRYTQDYDNEMNRVIAFSYTSAKEFSKDITRKFETEELNRRQVLIKLTSIATLVCRSINEDIQLLELDDNGSYKGSNPSNYLYETMGLLKRFDPGGRKLYETIRIKIVEQYDSMNPTNHNAK